MPLNNSLEKETITLSDKNRYKIGCIAEKMGGDATADDVVNTLLDFLLTYSSQPAKDLRFICKKRIDEIDSKYGSMTPKEAQPYLNDLKKYEWLDKFLEKIDMQAIFFHGKGEEEFDEEDEDNIP